MEVHSDSFKPFFPILAWSELHGKGAGTITPDRSIFKLATMKF